MNENDRNEKIQFVFVDAVNVAKSADSAKCHAAYKKMSEELSQIKVNRGADKSYGFVFEYQHAAEANVSHVHNKEKLVSRVVNDNGPGDIAVYSESGELLHVQQAKCYVETTPLSTIELEKYAGQDLILPKDHPIFNDAKNKRQYENFRKRCEENNVRIVQSDVTRKQAERVDFGRKIEGKITKSEYAPVSTHLYEYAKRTEIVVKEGVKGAKYAVAFTAGFTMGSNFFDFLAGEKDVEEVLFEGVKCTAEAAAGGFVSSAGTSVVSGVVTNSHFLAGAYNCIMQSSGGQFVMSIGRNMLTKMPLAGGPPFLFGMAVGTAVATIKLLKEVKDLDRESKVGMRKVEEAEENAMQVLKQLKDHLKEIIDTEYEIWDENLSYGFEKILSSSLKGEVEGVVQGLEQILGVFGQQVRFKTVEEYMAQLDDVLVL